MILTLLVVAAVDFHTNFQLLLAAVVLNNIFCATQDVAIDSLAVSTLKENERARGNGAMFGGQYLGIALGGGGAVFVYGLFGFDMALTYVSALLFLSLLFVVFFIQDPGVDLYAELAHAPGYTILREINVVADHNAYHVGELAIFRQVMGLWPAETSGVL